MQKTYLILSLVFSVTTFASSELTCSKNGTALLFVNGVNTTEIEARQNAKKTWELGLAAQIDKKAILKDFYYNQSLGVLKDFMESGIQLIEQTLGTGDYKAWSHYLRFGQIPTNLGSEATRALINQRLGEIRNGILFNLQNSSREQDIIGLSQMVGGYLAAERKVLLVSHSQGNFFANSAYSTLQLSEVSSKLKFYANFQVAPPTSEVRSKGLYIKLLDDVIVGNVPFSLPGNYSQVGPDWSFTDEDGEMSGQDSVHHNFLDTYTSVNVFGDGAHGGTMDYIFKETLLDVAAKLESNCSDQPKIKLTYDQQNPYKIHFDATKLTNAIPNAIISGEFVWEWGDGSQNKTTVGPLSSHTYSEFINYSGTLVIPLTNGTKTVSFTADLSRFTGNTEIINSNLGFNNFSGESPLLSAMDLENDYYYLFTSSGNLVSFKGKTGEQVSSIPLSNVQNVRWMGLDSKGDIVFVSFTLLGSYNYSIVSPSTGEILFSKDLSTGDVFSMEGFALDSERSIFYYTIPSSDFAATLFAMDSNTGTLLGTVADYYAGGPVSSTNYVRLNASSVLINSDGWLVRSGGLFPEAPLGSNNVHQFQALIAKWDPETQAMTTTTYSNYFPIFGPMQGIDNNKDLLYVLLSTNDFSGMSAFAAIDSSSGDLVYSVPATSFSTNFYVSNSQITNDGHIVGTNYVCEEAAPCIISEATPFCPPPSCAYSLIKLLRTDDTPSVPGVN